MYLLDESDGCRIVPVDADGVGEDGNVYAVHRSDHAVLDHAHRAGDGAVAIGDDRAGSRARHEAAVRLIGAIRKHLAGPAQAGLLCCREQAAARQPEDDCIGCDSPDPSQMASAMSFAAVL